MKLYPKIDLHIDGNYWGTTERYPTLSKALQALKSQAPVYTKGKLSQFLTASFKDSAGRRRIKIYKNRKKKTRKKVVRRKRRSRKSMSEKRVMRIKRGLMKGAKKLRLGAKRTGAYVYGTLRRIVGNPAKGVWSHVPFIRLSNSRTGKKIKTYPLDSLKWTARERSDIKTLMEVGGRSIQIGDFVYEKLNALARARSNAWPRNALGMTITPVNYSGLRGNPMRSSFDKPTFGPGQAEYRRVDTTTMAGMKEAERLQRAGWYQAQATPFSTTFYRRKIRKNPPMYAHGMTAHRTHGLSLKQMMKLYRLVSSGNPKAVMYARRTLGIPMSESLSQVKAVVYHHVLDLKGKI